MLVAVQLFVRRIVSPAGVRNPVPDRSAPDDHFTASPDCGVSVSAGRRVGGAGSCPTVRAGIVSAAGVQNGAISPPQTIISLPVQTAVCCASASGSVGGAGSCPTICAGIVSSAGVQIAEIIQAAPDDHFAAGPHCCVIGRRSGRIGGAGSRPTIGAGIVSAAGVQVAKAIICRPRRSFHCRSIPRCADSRQWARCCAGSCPTIGAGIVSAAGVRTLAPSSRPRRSFQCQSTLLCEISPVGALVVLVASNYPCSDCISRRCSNSRV